MSDVKEQFKQDMAKQEEIDKRQKDLQEKKLIIDERRTNIALEKISQAEEAARIAKQTNFGEMTPAQLDKIRKENLEYMVSAKNSMTFIGETFNGLVPFFRKNLFLIGGKTGEGKSTAVANIIRETIRQVNKETGKRRKVLVLTNEEKAEDVYNRVTCLTRGWHYTNHDKFTPEQIAEFDKMIPVLAKDGMLTVIDDGYGGNTGMTTTVEGIESIFEGLIRDKIHYDVIVLDYYQNVKGSQKEPYLNEYEVQARLSYMLDRYKNIYDAPIVVMAQVNPPDEKGTPFEFRIKGRKIIMVPSTLIMEMVADRENLMTKWIIHKSRFTEAIGKSIDTGYKYGRFVKYDADFRMAVAKMREDAKALQFDKQIGIKIKENEDGNNDQGN